MMYSTLQGPAGGPPRPNETLVTKAGSVFAVFDGAGDIDDRRRGEAGLYFNDTRYLRLLRVRLAGQSPVPVSVEGEGARSVHHLRLPPSGAQPALELERVRVLGATIEETITVRNSGEQVFRGGLCIDVDADFRSMFSIRGIGAGRVDGASTRGKWMHRSGMLQYEGADGRRRSIGVSFSSRPHRLVEGMALFRLRLAPGAAQTIKLRIKLREQGQPAATGRMEADLLATTRVESDCRPFDDTLRRSLTDLRTLVSHQGGRAYLAAGAPWFVALFGRDSMLAALQSLAFEPRLARDTLLLLARHQGRRLDPVREEEPGKILHEVRVDELSNLGQTWNSPYYGSVDATPLFLVLLGEYVRWTGDLDLFRRLRSAVDGALRWLDRHGDHDGDGFVDYKRQRSNGLVNQGWKDSDNCIVNADGTLGEPPIALVEVQAYAYRARIETARLYRATGLRARALAQERKARALRRRILDHYWMPERSFLALALQREGRRVETIASNAGHALWAGCLPRARARAVAGVLMDERMFSGWGIRTLAEGEPGYDPFDYQVGAVWPHDTAMIGAGLKRYGRQRDFERVFTAVVETALHFPNQRLPELFGGHRREGAGPHPYPVACSPQAWAAGAIPYLLITALGLQPDALSQQLRIERPRLPRWLERVRLEGLRVAGTTVDLEWRRTGGRTEVEVLRQPPGLQVVTGAPARSTEEAA